MKQREVVEHCSCGCIREQSAFADECPKCGDSEIEQELRAVGTVSNCEKCDTNWRPHSQNESPTDVSGALAAHSIDLTAYRRQSSDRGQLMAKIRDRIGARSAAIVVFSLILVVGLGGAAFSTALLADDTESPMASADDGEWTEYETIVVFRNDDIQPWYKSETMRAVDRVFIEEDVPVTLGVIPAVAGADSPITESDETCEYLQSLLRDHPGQFEITTHGYTHDQRTNFYTGSEFGGIPNETQSAWMTTGTDVLADCTGVRPRTFIPPMNTYDDGTVAAAVEDEYRTISGGDWFTAEYYNETGVFTAGGLTHISEGTSFVDWEHGEFHSQSELQAAFDSSYESNEIHIQMLHYQTFDTEADREKLRTVIRHMSSRDTAFLTLDQLATGIESGEIRETEDGWEIREPLETPDDAPDRLDDSTGVDHLFSHTVR